VVEEEAKQETSKNQTVNTLQPWRWRQYFPRKQLWT
jgi:hypothetical protein